jgi:octaprenyl-diphosphate synthase
MRRGTPAQAAVVRHAIETGGRGEFEQVLQAIHETEALEEARRHARIEARLATEALAALPPSIFKETLLKLCDFAVERNY